MEGITNLHKGRLSPWGMVFSWSNGRVVSTDLYKLQVRVVELVALLMFMSG